MSWLRVQWLRWRRRRLRAKRAQLRVALKALIERSDLDHTSFEFRKEE